MDSFQQRILTGSDIVYGALELETTSGPRCRSLLAGILKALEQNALKNANQGASILSIPCRPVKQHTERCTHRYRHTCDGLLEDCL
jgi:hypothetical protein